LIVDCGANVISNVKIRGAELALSFTANEVHLQNVEVSNSVTALSLQASNASLQLSDCRFYGNQYVLNAAQNMWHVNVSSCVFKRNQRALQLRDAQFVGIVDSQFSDNTYCLYSSVSYGLQVNVSSSVFRRNYHVVWLDRASFVGVVDSQFSDNSQSFSTRYNALFMKRSRFDDDAVVMTAKLAFIEDCVFNSSTLRVGAYYRPLLISVTNSTFNSSRIQTSSRGLNLSIVGSSFRRMVYQQQAVVDLSASYLDSAVISDNVFEENSGSPCIRVNVPAISGFIKPGNLSIVGNRFTNHSDSNVVVINDRAYHRVQLKRNVFHNPLCPFEIEVQSPWLSGYAVNSSENWWGSANRTYMAERVSDFFIDSKKAQVSITSIYTDPEMAQLEVIPDPRMWNVTDGKVVGGQLDRNVTLTNSTVPYLVSKTIYIPKRFYLYLEGNVTMHFAENRGVVVEGEFIIEFSSNR